MAFLDDFKLPLEGTTVHITIRRAGVDVENGYDRVVADSESLWLELSEHQISKSRFERRPLTRSR